MTLLISKVIESQRTVRPRERRHELRVPEARIFHQFIFLFDVAEQMPAVCAQLVVTSPGFSETTEA